MRESRSDSQDSKIPVEGVVQGPESNLLDIFGDFDPDEELARTSKPVASVQEIAALKVLDFLSPVSLPDSITMDPLFDGSPNFTHASTIINLGGDTFNTLGSALTIATDFEYQKFWNNVFYSNTSIAALSGTDNALPLSQGYARADYPPLMFEQRPSFYSFAVPSSSSSGSQNVTIDPDLFQATSSARQIMIGIGMEGNSDPSNLTDYDNWMGRPAEILTISTGWASHSDFVSSMDYLIGRWGNFDVPLVWSIPLAETVSAMTTAAAGGYDSIYTGFAQKILAAAGAQDVIYIRPGWELNLPSSHFPWSAVGNEANYIAAFQNLVDAFRAVSDKFVFEWNVNIGDYVAFDPATAYPGDSYVDIIGMDFYWDVAYSTDPIGTWNYMVNQSHGLQWFENFAASHGKPTAYSEWGINANTAGPYIQKAMEWFLSHDVVYANYWNTHAGFDSRLDDGSYPTAAAVYQAAFGNIPLDVPNWNETSALWPVWTNGTAAAETFTGQASGSALYDAVNDAFHGGGGADIFQGGQGNDLYIVTNAGETIIENTNEGIDIVISNALSYTLANNAEYLYLRSVQQDQTGTGNALDNNIYGSDRANIMHGEAGNDFIDGGLGNDVIAGDAGADILYGGGGADIFMFDFATAFSGIDTIMDFDAAGGDKIDLSNLIQSYDTLNHAITDYVQITTSGANIIVRVDADGLANGTSFVQIATINGVTGMTDEATLLQNGTLMV